MKVLLCDVCNIFSHDRSLPILQTDEVEAEGQVSVTSSVQVWAGSQSLQASFNLSKDERFHRTVPQNGWHRLQR